MNEIRTTDSTTNWNTPQGGVLHSSLTETPDWEIPDTSV